MGVRLCIQSCSPVGVALRCRDVGVYPPHGKGTWVFPEPGGVGNEYVDPSEEVRREAGLQLVRGGESGGGV